MGRMDADPVLVGGIGGGSLAKVLRGSIPVSDVYELAEQESTIDLLPPSTSFTSQVAPLPQISLPAEAIIGLDKHGKDISCRQSVDSDWSQVVKSDFKRISSPFKKLSCGEHLDTGKSIPKSSPQLNFLNGGEIRLKSDFTICEQSKSTPCRQEISVPCQSNPSMVDVSTKFPCDTDPIDTDVKKCTCEEDKDELILNSLNLFTVTDS